MSQQAGAPRMATVDPAAQDNYIYNRLLKERIIWLGSEVRDDNANAICSQLLLLSAENPEKDIYLYINSPGGSVTAGMAIYDTMQFIPNDVVTVATGLAASMGQFLLSSGTKGKRYATPNARILMHQPSGGIGGTASDIKIQAELILHMKKVMAELTADQTGQTRGDHPQGQRPRQVVHGHGSPRIRLLRQDRRARRIRGRRRRNERQRQPAASATEN